jgi:hypothetical protein
MKTINTKNNFEGIVDTKKYQFEDFRQFPTYMLMCVTSVTVCSTPYGTAMVASEASIHSLRAGAGTNKAKFSDAFFWGGGRIRQYIFPTSVISFPMPPTMYV